jgi:hypothetical protein
MPTYEVLCRIDAYADYIAKVKARTAKEAAELAEERHEAYQWAPMGTVEFDARFYVTLDKNGVEIESTHIGDM